MSRPLPLAGFRGYLMALVAVIVFPILWVRALRFAGAQSDADPNARAKVLAAIVISIVLLAAAVGAVAAFRASSEKGIYAQLEDRLVTATGEKELRDNEEIVRAKTETIRKSAVNMDIAWAGYQANGSALLNATETGSLAGLQALWDDVRALADLEARAVEALPVAGQEQVADAALKVASSEAKLATAAAEQRVAQAAFDAAEAKFNGMSASTPRTQRVVAEGEKLSAQSVLENKTAKADIARAELMGHRSSLDGLVAGAVLQAGLAGEREALQADILNQTRAQGLGAAVDAGQSVSDALQEAFLARLEAALAEEFTQAGASAEANATQESAQKAFAQGGAMDSARIDRIMAQHRIQQLAPNRAFYTDQVEPAIDARDDAAARDAIASTALAYSTPGSTPKEMKASSTAAFAIKESAVKEMDRFLWLFVYPGLAGLFLAPVVIAMGSILRKSFVPSDTVGYRPYPGLAMGLFLALGGFGIPAIPLAAWSVKDLENRAAEGQIAL